MDLRDLPSVERLASDPALADLPHDLAVAVCRETIADARARLRSGAAVDAASLARDAAERAAARSRPTLRPAINATGVLLHTNLGRATLSRAAAAAVAAVGTGHANLEVDEATGLRGARQSHVDALLTALTGAEDAFVVNNNAAATYLAMAGIAGREVVLGRGQMVEIGGHFRLPEVIVASGARLVEVGTTNRTRIGDYAAAITDQTAMLLRCHPSNFRVVGFTEEASLAELVALGRERGVLVGDDLGSGALVDFAPYGLTDEPQVRESVAAGADLIWFSGDKLLGGPQSGILVGRSSVVGPLKRHPLARALRPDKLTLAALEATLRAYTSGAAWTDIPILRRIAERPERLEARARRLARSLRPMWPGIVEPVRSIAEVGGGSMPARSLPSWAVAFSVADVGALARALRQGTPGVYGRIERDRFLLDLRAVDPEEDAALRRAVRALAQGTV